MSKKEWLVFCVIGVFLASLMCVKCRERQLHQRQEAKNSLQVEKDNLPGKDFACEVTSDNFLGDDHRKITIFRIPPVQNFLWSTTDQPSSDSEMLNKLLRQLEAQKKYQEDFCLDPEPASIWEQCAECHARHSGSDESRKRVRLLAELWREK